MQVSNVSIAASSCEHLVITATFAGQVRTIHVSRSELALEPGEAQEAFLHRLRSFAKENGYNLAQLRANLAGKVFHV